MQLSTVNEILDHNITSGSEYLWKCYPNARFLDYENDYAYVSVVYSTGTREVYDANICVKPHSWVDKKEPKPYRWLNPNYKQDYIDEAASKNVNYKEAWDDTLWVDLEVEDDWLEKARDIFNGLEVDERVQVPLDLEPDILLEMCMEAHKRDITLNQFVEEILRAVVEKHKKDNKDLDE